MAYTHPKPKGLRPQISPAPQKPGQITTTKVLIPLNVPSKNGRIYTKENLQDAVDEFKARKKSIGVIYGEIDPRTLDTSLSRVSHTVEDIWFDNNNKLMGEIRVINTYSGKEMQILIDSGIDLAVRPRILGSIDDNGYVIVERLYTFDFISTEGFVDNQELRKIKLERLEEIANTGSYVERTDIPTFDESFFYLKK